MAERRRLVVVAPARLHRVLGAGLGAAGWEVRCVGRPPAGGGADPYGLGAVARCWAGWCHGLLLAAPGCRPPRRCCSGPVVGGLPVGLVFGDRPADLRPWLDALVQDSRRPPDGGNWGVLSPWDGHHLPVARQLRRRLREAGFGVEGWFADRLALAGLLAQLARGPALAIYLGHGSPWGLDAFGGVGLAKIGASKPWRSCGSLALLACRTAAPRGSAPGFATMLQAEGRVLSCLAAVADVEQATNAALARRLVGALADGARSLGECLVRLDRELGLGDPRRRALRAYRLLGLPLQPVRSVGSELEGTFQRRKQPRGDGQIDDPWPAFVGIAVKGCSCSRLARHSA